MSDRRLVFVLLFACAVFLSAAVDAAAVAAQASIANLSIKPVILPTEVASEKELENAIAHIGGRIQIHGLITLDRALSAGNKSFELFCSPESPLDDANPCGLLFQRGSLLITRSLEETSSSPLTATFTGLHLVNTPFSASDCVSQGVADPNYLCSSIRIASPSASLSLDAIFKSCHFRSHELQRDLVLAADSFSAVRVSGKGASASIYDSTFRDLVIQSEWGAASVYSRDAKKLYFSNCLFEHISAPSAAVVAGVTIQDSFIMENCIFNDIQTHESVYLFGDESTYPFNIKAQLTNCSFTNIISSSYAAIYMKELGPNMPLFLENVSFKNVTGHTLSSAIYGVRSSLLASSLHVASSDSGVSSVFMNHFYDLALENSSFKNCKGLQGGAVAASVSLSSADVDIQNTTFQSSLSTDQGGAVFLSGVNAFINNCIFEDNSALLSGGGAVFSLSSVVKIKKSIFKRNSAPAGHGGALSLTDSDGDISSSNFEENWSLVGGGSVSFSGQDVDPSLSMISCSISSSTATLGGGLLIDTRYLVPDYSITLLGTNFTSNGSPSRLSSSSPPYAYAGGAIYAGRHNAIYMDGCNFLQNKASHMGGALFIDSDRIVMSSRMLNSIEVLRSSFVQNEVGSTHSQSRRAASSPLLAHTQTVYSSFPENVISSGYGAGGAIFASGSPSLFILTVKFMNNTVVGAGGALAMHRNVTGNLVAVQLIGNKAIEGNGGAVYISAGAKGQDQFPIFDVKFIENRAEVAGGAIYWDAEGFIPSAPTGPYNCIAGCEFESNVSPQGTNYASRPSTVNSFTMEVPAQVQSGDTHSARFVSQSSLDAYGTPSTSLSTAGVRVQVQTLSAFATSTHAPCRLVTSSTTNTSSLTLLSLPMKDSPHFFGLQGRPGSQCRVTASFFGLTDPAQPMKKEYEVTIHPCLAGQVVAADGVSCETPTAETPRNNGPKKPDLSEESNSTNGLPTWLILGLLFLSAGFVYRYFFQGRSGASHPSSSSSAASHPHQLRHRVAP